VRVALVCPYAWDRHGGVQSHVRALARALRRRGHDVAVIAPRARPRRALPADDDGAVMVGRSVPIPANGSLAPVAFGPGAGAATRRALRDLVPDVVHLHEPLIPSVSLLALLNSAAPAAGTFHAAAPRSLGYGSSRPLLERAARRIAVRTAVSEAARALVGRYFPGDYLITPNGVELARFRSARPADWGPGRKVLFAGRLERRKGLDVLVRAMAEVRDLGATLVVAGDGPDGPPARALARRLGVEVLWAGSPSDQELAAAYRRADAYCAPNLRGESFGVVLIEAMAAGAPVVCSDLPSFRSVAGGAAALVAPGDHVSLAAALRRTLTDTAVAERMRVEGRRAAARFDWDELVAGVESVYERCRALGPPPYAGARAP
jgi:phosphatidylinositol alpha-mannosyltransferase